MNVRIFLLTVLALSFSISVVAQEKKEQGNRDRVDSNRL